MEGQLLIVFSLSRTFRGKYQLCVRALNNCSYDILIHEFIQLINIRVRLCVTKIGQKAGK